MFKLDLEKAEEPEVKLPTSVGSSRKQENCRKTSIAALLTMPKPLTVWTTINWKILQDRLQQYVTRELPDVQAGFRKGRGTRDQIVNILWIMEKAREFQKNINFCFIHYAKAFDCVETSERWEYQTT